MKKNHLDKYEKYEKNLKDEIKNQNVLRFYTLYGTGTDYFN